MRRKIEQYNKIKSANKRGAFPNSFRKYGGQQNDTPRRVIRDENVWTVCVQEASAVGILTDNGRLAWAKRRVGIEDGQIVGSIQKIP